MACKFVVLYSKNHKAKESSQSLLCCSLRVDHFYQQLFSCRQWLETKLTELGMLTTPGYKFCFVLDKTSMFTITSTKRDGASFVHHIKPLQIIWTKFPRWGSHNTVHVDDLSRNFALNLGSGLKVSGFYRKKSSARRDSELLGLSRYLEQVAQSGASFDDVDFNEWLEVVSGKQSLIVKKEEPPN